MLEVDTLEEDLMTLGGSPKLQSTLIKTIMDTTPKTEKYALISKKFGRNRKIWVCSPGIPTNFWSRFERVVRHQFRAYILPTNRLWNDILISLER
jgi:hypothetical protein